MTGEALRTAWLNSRAANSALIVLLAITFEIEENGRCDMNIAELAKRARLSENATRIAVRDLEQLGEVGVASRRPGRGGGCTYLVTAGWAWNPTKSGGLKAETPQNLEGSNPTESGGFNQPRSIKIAGQRPNPPESGGFQIPDALDCSVVSGNRSKSKAVSETPRADVDRLCEHLADKIAERGSKRPKIGKRWRDAARLMLDSDGRTEADVHKAIDWCQSNHFWHRNILSMEKLREKYDRLRLDAIAEQKSGSPASGGRQESNLDVVGRLMQRAAQMEGGN